MTTTDGGHVDLDALADHAEGLLDPAAAAAVESHLAGCPACRATADALAGLPALLAAAGETGPMPADVAARVDAALAAEVAQRPAAADASPQAAATVTPLRAAADQRHRLPWSSRLLQAAAAVVVLAAGTAVVYGVVHSPGSSTTTASTAAGGSADALGAPKAAPVGSPALVSSGTDWTRATLRRRTGALVAGAAGASARLPSSTADDSAITAPTAAAAPEGGLSLPAPAAEKPRLLACAKAIAKGLGSDAPLVAVDVARYAGKPAEVYVFRAGPTTLDVYVAPAPCNPADPGLLDYESGVSG